MKVSDLSGAQLDYWVAKATGQRAEIIGGAHPFCVLPDDDGLSFYASTDWNIGGQIIERERIGIDCVQREQPRVWRAYMPLATGKAAHEHTGPTPLIAAMRCFVASKFGEEVPNE